MNDELERQLARAGADLQPPAIDRARRARPATRSGRTRSRSSSHATGSSGPAA